MITLLQIKVVWILFDVSSFTLPIQLEKNSKNKKYCFITITPNKGGLESRDFCNILSKMIEKYCKKNQINFEYIENTDYSKVLRVNSLEKIFLDLNGLHKITRISPFGKGDKLYTSLCKVSILKPKNKVMISINDNDIKMDFYKSTGPGGQHKNKTMSAVRLIHIPTNIMVTSDSERSQHENRKYAYEQLYLKLENLYYNKEKLKKSNKRLENLEKDKIIACYYLNHSLAVNEVSGQKTTNIKQLMNGDLNLIFKN